MDNVTVFSAFVLSGFHEKISHRFLLFSLTLLCYCAILLVNICVMVIIILDRSLHEPMYILLGTFCLNALVGTAGFYPRFLWDLISPVHIISYSGCLVQTQVLYSYLSTDLSILAVMAYDRYVAICRPLRYHAVMSKRGLLKLVVFSWITPSAFVAVNVSLTSRLRLCSPFISRLYCANWIIVTLACSRADTVVNSVVSYVSILIYTFHGVFIVWTYTRLVKTCVSSTEHREKFVQTCVPHLLSLTTFLFAILIDLMNMRFGSGLPRAVQNFIAVEVFVVPPLMNPLIYGFILSRIRKKVLGYVTLKAR